MWIRSQNKRILSNVDEVLVTFVDEEILVSDGDSVWQDTWCEADEGYELFSGIEIEDLAWRQLPKPYEENQNENNC